MRDAVIVGGYEYRHADGQWGIRQVGADVPFSPVTWPHTVAMIERIRELEALAAATRVRVLDEWRVTDKDGSLIATFSTEDDANRFRVSFDDDDLAWPQYAPHRVVRVALVDADSHQSVPSDYATRVTDEMVERAIRVGRDYGYFDWDESGEERVAGMRAVLSAALEGPRD